MSIFPLGVVNKAAVGSADSSVTVKKIDCKGRTTAHCLHRFLHCDVQGSIPSRISSSDIANGEHM